MDRRDRAAAWAAREAFSAREREALEQKMIRQEQEQEPVCSCRGRWGCDCDCAPPSPAPLEG
jgi:hypothetical protein